MTIAKDGAEAQAMRALLLAMAWQAMIKSGDPVANASELRGYAEETKGAIMIEHLPEAWDILDDILGSIEGLARQIAPDPKA